MPRREAEDRFLTALKAQDFDQNDGSADAYLVLFGTDDTICETARNLAQKRHDICHCPNEKTMSYKPHP